LKAVVPKSPKKYKNKKLIEEKDLNFKRGISPFRIP